jgi:hypothetical protein
MRHAVRKRVSVALDDIVKLLGESDGFFVCQVKVHDPDMGSQPATAKARLFQRFDDYQSVCLPQA